jgi:hypothetical protein
MRSSVGWKNPSAAADKEHVLEFDVDVERRAAIICIDAALYGPHLNTTFSNTSSSTKRTNPDNGLSRQQV